MLTVKDIMDTVEMQTTVKFCYYDYQKEDTIEITEKEAWEYEPKYMYVKDDILYIEVRKDEE